MTLATSDDVRIDTLYLRGRNDEVDSLKQQMSQVNWPVNDKTWVFIKSVKVKSSVNSVSRKLTEQTRDAVSGGDANNVKVFKSLALLLSELIADIAHNRAHEKWYWAHWAEYLARPKADAITSLLVEHKTETIAVLNQLRVKNDILKVLTTLESHHIDQLYSNQFPSTTNLLRTAPTPKSEPQAVSLSNANIVLQLWKKAFNSVSTYKKHRMWLAANVVQQHFPLAWLMSPEATLFELFKRIDVKKATQPNLQQTSFNKKPSDSREAIQRSFSLSNHQPVPTKPINEQLVTTTPKDSKPNDNKPFVPKQKTGKPEPVDYTTKASDANLINTEVRKSRHTGDHPKHFNENQTVHPNERTVSNTDGSPVLSSDVQNSPLEPLTFEHEFSTHYAGTFYLLNLLNRPDAQNILKTHWQHADHGLLWLHQLATRLGLPKQDPINHYIANELNYDHSELIAIEELQGLNGIVTLGQQWYGKQGLWQPTLLELPATIEADESHIDMTVADSLINIDIRVMGLDINPGWLPWLGKVVSFHYIPGGRTK